MTEREQKAIKWMQNVRDDAVVTLDHIAKEEPDVSPMLYAGRKQRAETIINGFEELEKYRAIGTPEECRAAVEKQKELKSTNTCGFVAIGKTVEQFEQEIRNKAIDDFLEKIQWEYLNSCGIEQKEIEFLIAVSSQVAENLKAGDGE